jgi:YHS domain-containing protein
MEDEVMRRVGTFSVCLTAMLMAAGINGCQSKPPDPKAVADKLAKADAVDGSVDKALSKCLGCGLAMNGKKEIAATTAGYTLHFCSDPCKRQFEKDPGQAVMAMKIPSE